MSYTRHIKRQMARTALAAAGVTRINRQLAKPYGLTDRVWHIAADECVRRFKTKPKAKRRG